MYFYDVKTILRKNLESNHYTIKNIKFTIVH